MQQILFMKLVITQMLIVSAVRSLDSNEYCDAEKKMCNNKDKTRYLLYDVNPPEGFNLRRDVYLRYAVLANKLKSSRHEQLQNFKLVLPPWSHLYHWTYEDKPEHIPWSFYFDIKSLQSFAPVIDMHTYFTEIGVRYSAIKIDDVYVLQHFENMFETGNFEDKMSIGNCNKAVQLNFYYYDNITSNNVKCLSFHGHASQLTQILRNSTGRSILFDHSEIALHDRFGDRTYWEARRSMRFNNELRKIANKFREKYLNSADEDDTTLPDDWRQEKSRRNARGGPYLSVHLRRRDFIRGRPKEVPSIDSAAKQIESLLKKQGLNSVFVATDAPDEEFKQLKALLNRTVVKYTPDAYIFNKFKDGGVAIIEQIICSYARFFVGTHESTFSFRIQEEREIIGFPVETTFNRLCGANKECEKPSLWKIVY